MTWKEPHPKRLPLPEEIKENKTRVEELISQVAIINRNIDKLFKRRSQLQREISERRSFLAAFRRLPPEILSEIALRCVEGGGSPSQLNQICTSMRDAVNGTKSLWAKMYLACRKADISSPDYRGYILCRNPQYLQLLLDRSCPLPLTVTLEFPGSIIHLIESLAPAARAIQTLGVIDWGPTQDLPWLDLANVENLYFEEGRTGSANFDSICEMMEASQTTSKKLIIGLNVSSSALYGIMQNPLFPRIVGMTAIIRPTMPRQIYRTLITVPQLQHLELTGNACIMTHLDLPAVRFLRIDGSESQCKLKIDRIPKSLLCLELENLSLISTSRQMQPHVLPRLTKVVLHQVDSAGMDPGMLLAPALEELETSDFHVLNCANVSENNRWTDNQHLFGTSHLKTLILPSQQLNEALIRYLRNATELRVFKMTECLLSGQILSWLSGLDEQRGNCLILPNLIEVIIRDCRCFGDTYTFSDFMVDFPSARPLVRLQVEQYQCYSRDSTTPISWA